MAIYSYTRKTTFAESDAAGVIHFSRFACYVEEAEHAFLSEAGFAIDLNAPNALLWPRVHFSADYTGPVFPVQPITVELEVSAIGESSITWAWKICNASNTLLASGQMKTVCCRKTEAGLTSELLPPALLSKLQA